MFELSVRDTTNPIFFHFEIGRQHRSSLGLDKQNLCHLWCDLTKEEWLPMIYYDTALINSLYATRTTKDGTKSCPWSPSILYSTFISRHQVSTVVVMSATKCFLHLQKPYYLSSEDCIASATQSSLQTDT